MTALRPYQTAALDHLDAALETGKRSPLIVAPTGSGKTVLAAEIIRRRGGNCLFLAPRRELVHQTCRKLDDVGVPYGVLLAGDDRTNLYRPVQVASIDTVFARVVRRDRVVLPDFGLIVVDEAHLSITKARLSLLARWPDAIRVGLTATPIRKDGRALGLIYDELLEVATPADLTAQSFLVPARYYSVCEPDLSRVTTVAGDYHQGELAAAMNQTNLVGDVVGHWLEHAGGRRTVVFATSIEHSVALAAQFRAQGVVAEHVDAGTPQVERDALFQRFRSGDTQVLTNCFLASYGFDLPELDCIVLARPTKSLMLYLQMLGRGLRPASGKADCLVLDHAGNVHRHGFATDDRYWTLDGSRSLDAHQKRQAATRTEEKTLTCPDCKCVFTGSRTCPDCGYYFAPRGRIVETVDGQLVEIGQYMARDRLEELEFYLQLRAISEERHYRAGFAAHRFKERFGKFPPFAWNAFPSVAPSMATRRWFKSRQIAFAKARERLSA
jgi:superfamily II DNA or RNA helicase